MTFSLRKNVGDGWRTVPGRHFHSIMNHVAWKWQQFRNFGTAGVVSSHFFDLIVIVAKGSSVLKDLTIHHGRHMRIGVNQI